MASLVAMIAVAACMMILSCSAVWADSSEEPAEIRASETVEESAPKEAPGVYGLRRFLIALARRSEE